MKKTRILALVLAGAMVAGAVGVCGCKKKDASEEDEKNRTDVSDDVDGSGKDGNGSDEDGHGSGNGSDDKENSNGSGNGNGSGAGARGNRDTSKITIGIPDDNMISGLASRFGATGSVLFAYTANGEYKESDMTSYSTAYSEIIAEYVFSEEFYEQNIHKGGNTKTTYDEYVEQMKEQMPDEAELLGDDLKLKELPDERFFFSIMGRALNQRQSPQPDRELLEEAVRTGMSMLFEDPLCQAHFEKYIKMDELVYDMPYIYGITIVWVSERSAYVLVEGTTLDSSKFFSKTEYVSLDGEPAKLGGSVENLTISALGFAGEPRIKYNINDAEQSQALISDLMEFFEAHSDADDGNPWRDYDYANTMTIDGSIVSVFSYDETEMAFQYLGNGEWFYTDMFENIRTFTVTDEKENHDMLERIYEEAARAAFWKCGDLMTIVNGSWKVDWDKEYDSSRVTAEQKEANFEIMYKYIDEREFQSIFRASDDNSMYFCENKVRQTDAKVDGVPVTEDVDYYEFIMEDDVAYARYDTVPEYSKVDTGSLVPGLSFAKTLDLYEFVGGYEVDFTEFANDEAPESLAGPDAGYGFDANGHRLISNTTYVPAYCEIYRAGDGYDDETIAILLTSDGHIIGGWEYGSDGLIVYYFIGLGTMDVDLHEDIEFAEGNTAESNQQKKDDAEKTAEDWQREDLTAHGFFDLAGTVTEGPAIDSSPVVQGYIDYFQSLQPFTIEMWTFGAYRVEETVLSFDGTDFYDFTDVSSHDGSFDYDLTRVLIGDTMYTTGSDGMQRSDPKSEYCSDSEILYSLPGIFIPTHTVKFQRAYNGTLDGQEYVIEEWTDQGGTFTFFCRDGEILAVKYWEFGYTLYCYFAEFSRSADSDLIRKPF